ncbi:hypothetical protein BUALT_Bualt19G0128400 [Buddleja alternifolia]|uniref:Mechanosensitive ion channel protein n=1 Tax=Buddleja alternifolia TaxID=168488 RepID=A0AAV6W3P3_9LAMI|nr:hypothetical protein BUALT_Bualt19G0128400 [Buddleja alternifolia]
MSGSPEFIVKIDGSDQPASTTNIKKKNWRESSLDLWRDDTNAAMQHAGNSFDPPSKLIGQFLNKQKAAGVETSLDMDLEMDELRDDNSNRSSDDDYNMKNPNFSTSKELKVSFHTPISSGDVNIGPDEEKICKHDDNGGSSSDENDNHMIHYRRRSSNMDSNNNNNNNNVVGDESQVLRCTSIQRRFSGFGRVKTRSRLIDPPETQDRRSGTIKSGQIKSGMLGRASGLLQKPGDDDDDDPLFDEDLPDEYKKAYKVDALTIAQWISLILIVTFLSCTLAISKWKSKKLRGLSLWKWEVLVLVLICGRLVSGWWIKLVVFFIERNFFMRKRILYFVYGVRKAVQNCIWLGLVLIAWHYMFDKEVDGNNKFLQYVNKIMVCLLVGTLLWLVKTLMVKVLASSFHVSTFFDRIQESVFNQYVIETLSGPSLIEIRNYQDEEDRTVAEVWRLQNIAGATLPPELAAQPRGGGLPPKPPPAKLMSFRISGPLLSKNQDENQGISIDHLHRLNNKNVSAWNMKRLINVVKHGALSTLDEQAMDNSQGDEATKQIRSECSPESEKISKASLKNWVVNAFRERKALALTLNDTKTAVNKLHQMVNVIVGIIILIICIVILEIATSKVLLFVSSQIVVVAFVFGNTCKTIFEDVIFVFIMHPFDVGDRCEIDGVQMIVEEMNILTTVFLRADNQKILYPNVTLATKPIGNYYRSPDMGDSVDFGVHIATPAEKIAIIKQRITSYIENRSDHWYPSPSVVLMNFDDLKMLKLSVWIRHRMNHQDMGEKWKRRALLVEEMVRTFKELDIEYRLYPIDINVRGMPLPESTRIPSTWTPAPGD